MRIYCWYAPDISGYIGIGDALATGIQAAAGDV